MTSLTICLSMSLHGVVDRVEPPMAVVEWSADLFADIPLDWLPAPVAEGDRLSLELSADDAGPALAAGPSSLVPAPRPDARPIPLPGAPALTVGARYRFAALQHDQAQTVQVEPQPLPASH